MECKKGCFVVLNKRSMTLTLPYQWREAYFFIEARMGAGGWRRRGHSLPQLEAGNLSLTHTWILFHFPQIDKLVPQEKSSNKLIFLEIIQNISIISEIILLIFLNSKKVYNLCFTLFWITSALFMGTKQNSTKNQDNLINNNLFQQCTVNYSLNEFYSLSKI